MLYEEDGKREDTTDPIDEWKGLCCHGLVSVVVSVTILANETCISTMYYTSGVGNRRMKGVKQT